MYSIRQELGLMRLCITLCSSTFSIGGDSGKGVLSCAEQAAEEILSIPLYPQLEAFQVRRVIDVILHHCRVLSSART